MKIQTDKTCLNMIRELSDAFGPSGFEDAVAETARNYTADLGELQEDCLRNFYINRKENTGNRPVFMLDAHSDEVGFMVHSIKPNGTLRILNIGRWNNGSLSSNKVLVRNADGRYIPGIIASKPVHFMTPAEQANGGNPDISSLIVDIGATSAEEATRDFRIRIGEPIVPDVHFEYDAEHDVMFGKAFDCRIGCAALIETMRRLQGEELNVDIVGVLSSQEEVGDRGVGVAVRHVKPSIALCFEGCPADDTFTEPYAIQTALRKGPMLRFMDKSIICNPRYQRYALDLAERKGLPVQSSVRSGGGNNGAVINTSLDGIPVIVLGVPVRYIHSQNCITSYYDFEATVTLALEIIRSMTEEQIQKF